MSSELSTRQADQSPTEPDVQQQQPLAEGLFLGLLHSVHQHLRGRYKVAVPLALLLACAGAYAGFRFGKVVFKSTGQIVVAPVAPVVLKTMDDNAGAAGQPTYYEAFILTQISYLSSQRVLELALDQPAWRALGREKDDEAIREFEKNLKVSRIKDTEIISVEFTDTDDKAAMVGAASVINAYRRIYIEDDSHNVEKRTELLEQRKTALTNELAGLRQQVRKIAEQFSTDELDTLFRSKLADLDAQQKDLKEIQVALAQRGGVMEINGGDDLTPEQIACESLTMATYLKEKALTERQVDRLQSRVGQNHRSYSEACNELAAINKAIEEHTKAYRSYRKLGGAGSRTGGLGIAGVAIPTEQLKARQASLEEVTKKKEAEMLELGKQKLELVKFKDEAEAVKSRLEETRKRIDQLNLESAVSARIMVASYGDRPLKPYRDTRLYLAPAGFVGGVGLVLGFFILLGMMDRRIRYTSDAASSQRQSPILGILPMLPADLADPQQAAFAADCVNRIRTLLQIWSGQANHLVFAVTSPVAGTGKTSLTLALGVSFASAGSHTLLIDCDLVGGGLTNRMQAIVRRKLGQLLERKGLVTRQQVDDAMKLARSAGRKLGEALVEAGYIHQQEIATALAEQEQNPLGLLDALSGENLEDCAADTGIPHLHVLPLGTANAVHAGTLSPAALRRLVEAARERYDTIIVDTGPILGSLEAASAASVADGVILTVSCGEQRPKVEQSIQYLETVGAHLAGIVFNRARRDEIHRLVSYSASSSIHRSTALARRTDRLLGNDQTNRLGPVAGAVAAFAPPCRNGNGKRE